MNGVLLLGHGSMREEANRMLHKVAELVKPRLPGMTVEAAFMQFGKPDFFDGVSALIKTGVTSIVVHPYFLSAGDHVTKDIPEMIEKATKDHPGVSIVFSRPLGLHDALASVVADRVHEAMGFEAPPTGNLRTVAAESIEAESFRIIETELGPTPHTPQERAVLVRVIHATGDFSFASNLRFHSKAVESALRAIRAGRNILADVRMLEAGISTNLLSKFGGRVVCKLGAPEIEARARAEGKTRTETAIELGLKENIGIVAIGNAPTALARVVDLVDRGVFAPDLVVGVPVGFVNAAESKQMLISKPWPHIAALGRKGGTPVAAAIVNALIRLA